MKLLDFNEFVKRESLEGKDDETVVSALIKCLSEEIMPRVLIENFPKNDFQARFFIKNGQAPSQVFALKCSKDICQERMFTLGENHPDYLPSAILAKEISDYNQRSKKLMPMLKKSCQTYTIESAQALNQSIRTARKFIEPTLVHIRHSGSENSIDKKEEIRVNLIEQGYVELNVNDLVREEMERRTDLGNKLLNAYNTG
jgi:adenylate kinase family enzyme